MEDARLSEYTTAEGDHGELAWIMDYVISNRIKLYMKMMCRRCGMRLLIMEFNVMMMGYYELSDSWGL